jgi:hypothetical protein
MAADKFDRLFAPSLEFGGQIVVKGATIATDFLNRANRKLNVSRALSLVEMGGLEPRAPYMRSREIDWPGPCSIRVFRALSRLLPILLPTRAASRIVSMAKLCLIAKILRNLGVELLRQCECRRD